MVEQAPAQAYHLKKAAARMIVVLVELEMLREAIDALGKKCDLHLRRPRVIFLGCVLPDHLLLAFGAERHRGTFPAVGRIESGGGRDVVQPGRAKLGQTACGSGEMARLIHQFAAIAREKIASPYLLLAASALA